MAKRAEVYYDPDTIMPYQIAQVIGKLGYKTEVIKGGNEGTSVLDLHVSTDIPIFYFQFYSHIHLIDSCAAIFPQVLLYIYL